MRKVISKVDPVNDAVLAILLLACKVRGGVVTRKALFEQPKDRKDKLNMITKAY